MRLNNKIFKNASWIIVCRIVQMIINLVVGMLSARLLGPSNYGLINYACSIVAFAVPVMQLGLSSIMVHELMKDPDNEGEILGTSICMSLVSSLLCVVGVTAFAMVANAGEQETIVVCILCSMVLVFQSIELVLYWFQAKLWSKYTAIVMFFAYIVTAVYKIILLLTGKNVYWYAISQSIDYALIAMGFLYFYRKKGGQKFSVSLSRAKSLFSQSHHYIASALMVTLFSQTDRVMIKNMLDDAATGFYSCAVTCVGMTNFVFAAIIDSMRPSIFENKHQSKEKYENAIEVLYCIIIYLALAQSAAMMILAKPIISLLYGVEYISAIPVLQIMVWYTTFSYIGAVRNIWILAENKQKYLWKINLIGAITNIILNYVMIPILGINGAALATVITQLFTNVVLGCLLTPIRYNNRLMLGGLNIRKQLKQ